MRVAVTGGRTFDDIECVHRTLNAFHASYGIDALAHGNASGADTLAGSWAIKHGGLVVKFDAEWKRFGKRAGPIRNETMLREFKPDMLFVFPGGTGTAHCVSMAKKLGVPMIEAWTTTDAPATGGEG